MHDLLTLKRLNDDAAGIAPPRPAYELRFHPRIVALRHQVNALPVDPEYRRWLRHSLWRYADQIIDRVEPPQGEGWDDLEALQQVTLGDRMEASLRSLSFQ